MTKTMKASECKAKFLAVLDEVARTREPVTVTKNGTPVGQIVPVVNRPKTLFGALKGAFEIKGDIIGPVEDEWDDEHELRLIQGMVDEAPSRHPRVRVAQRRKPKSRPKRARDL
jgi:prevent-host-death family protein